MRPRDPYLCLAVLKDARVLHWIREIQKDVDVIHLRFEPIL